MPYPDAGTVDVIVPVHNQRELVEPCLASVLEARNQTTFELVVIDDTSTDAALKASLAKLAQDGRITLLTNERNLGFTQTVNRGMRLHPGRDVVLLNSDTLVFGDWIDRLRRAAHSDSRVGTAGPMSNGTCISCYPFRASDGKVAFEVTDAEIDAMAAEANRDRYVDVHYNVGFCLYIRGAVLDEIGVFDAIHFPIAYCEEADFCYRARYIGWRHVVAGNVFVRHWEGQSFQGRKAQLLEDMFRVFRTLHPGIIFDDENFARRDPVRPLREAIDLARVRRMLGDAKTLYCATAPPANQAGPMLHVEDATGRMQIRVPGAPTLVSLPVHTLPDDIAAFNRAMVRLGITGLDFASAEEARRFRALAQGRRADIGLQVALHPIEAVPAAPQASPRPPTAERAARSAPRAPRFSLIRLLRENRGLALQFLWGRNPNLPTDAEPWLHLGCGRRVFDGFLNLDYTPLDSRVLRWNFLDLWPDSLVDRVEGAFSEDCVEHFFLGEQIYILCNLNRAMRLGGTARILMPELGQIVNDGRPIHTDYDFVQRHYGVHGLANRINFSLRFTGHRWMHDQESLERMAAGCGFAATATGCVTSTVDRLSGLNLRSEADHPSFANDLRKTGRITRHLLMPTSLQRAEIVEQCGEDQMLFVATGIRSIVLYTLPEDVDPDAIVCLNFRSANLSNFGWPTKILSFNAGGGEPFWQFDETMKSQASINIVTRDQLVAGRAGAPAGLELAFSPALHAGEYFTLGPLEVFVLSEAT